MRKHRTFILEILEARALLASTPNDPDFQSQYALANTNAAGAWATTTGSPTVVIADIDSGADYTHQDLYENIWINQAEIPPTIKSKLKDVDGDGRITFYDLNSSVDRPLMTDVNHNGYIDAGDLLNPISKGGWEDGINGKSNPNDKYVDDIVGWDFAQNDNMPLDTGSGNEGHGTHTAGIMAAMGNNGVGISGVAQKTSLMLARIFNNNGDSASTSQIAAAIRYTADNGAKAANASWGSDGGSDGDPIYNAISYAGSKGELFVAAAGNDQGNLDSSRINDYPAEYDLNNIIVVSATTSSGGLADYSNYGSTESDIAAPGDNVLSTLPGNKYGRMSGTSMATPMVTGTVALMLSANKSLTASQIKQRIIAGADGSDALDNLTISNGQLDIANAVGDQVGTPVPDPGSNAGGGGFGRFGRHRRFFFSTRAMSDLLG